MLIRKLSTSALFLALVGVIVAQAPKTDDKGKTPPVSGEPDIDPISKQAAVIETQLAKTSSTSKEGAELMLKLIDLYHDNGRPFGLVRVAQTFVGLHSAHPRHKEAMLKLIDGLQTTGRNKELIASGRQFLARNPTDPACADIERWLARMLRKTNDALGAAAVLEAHAKRLGATADGPRAGRDAIALYFAINNPDAFAKAAALGEYLLDTLPKGEAATYAGWSAVDAHERLNAWAKANTVAAKLLAKSPPAAPQRIQALHGRMAENFSRLGQRTNAVESWRKAIAVANAPARPDFHARLIEDLFASNPKPAEFEPVANEFLSKFPDRTDKYAGRIRLASLYLTAKDPAKAEQILAEVLPFDARTHSASSTYVQLFGGDMDMNVRATRLAKAEQVLRAALAKSTPANAAALRYSLGLELLRDRTKDVAKAKAAAREIAFQFPGNDGYTSGAINYLLDAAADDAEFGADLAKLIEARAKFPWVGTYRAALNGWSQPRLKAKDVGKRAQSIQNELAKSDRDTVNQLWSTMSKPTPPTWSPQAAGARAKLLDPAKLGGYPDDLANNLFYLQQYYYRNFAPVNVRVQSVDIAKAWATRLPKSFEAAATYLSAATDYARTDAYRDAAALVVKLEPTSTVTDITRRLMVVAANFKDAALAQQAWTWSKKMFDKFGYDNSSSSGFGDTLTALGLKAEAKECWERALTGNPDGIDLRESAFRLLALLPDADKPKFIDSLLAKDSGWQFSFAVARAELLIKANEIDAAGKLLTTAANKVREQAFGGASPDSDYPALVNWVNAFRADAKATPADKQKLFTLVRDLKVLRASMVAQAALLELPEEAAKLTPMKKLLVLAEASQLGGTDSTDFDMLTPYAQAAMGRKDYLASATLVSGMLANFPAVDEGRRKAGRDLLTQAYTRLGAAGGSVIDEKSPIAPLLTAALQLRLGDQKLAFETYLANQKLFDANRAEAPVDLIVFVCDNHIAAGGDENHNRVEDILRTWLIKNAELKEIDEVEKARIQLLLARNYFRSKRYDLARAEFTSLHNRYPKTPQAVEADFGIGETFMEQKVYDQAEQAFERLAGSRERDVVIRAEFLRGVLASRRGDRDEARAIFRGVLERVPNIELANQALFNLSEVYGAEQRYVDQLELLRTVGRLGRASKRFHTPGEPLSIVVQDSDLGVSRGHSRIPVLVTTEPGGDEETIYLLSGGAGKGLFRADLETRLGTATKNDRILQLTGKDLIRVDYPPEFKKEFKDAPLPDTEIRIAADGKLEISSAKIVDEDEETFSKALQREAADDGDLRKGITRPKDQVKPGNTIYLRVKDADRDLTDQPDKIAVKLTATSGDTVTVQLTETGPHTGIFEGTAKSGELPVGALATNSAIDHSPLMAIDKDRKTAWLSEPDGATPKILSIDMKGLKRTDRVTIWTPDAKQNAPIRMTLEGSNDGRLWFRLATTHPDPTFVPVAGDSGPMTTRIYEGGAVNKVTAWDQVVALTKNVKPTTEGKAADLFWTRQPDEKPKRPTAVIWHGKLVQAKTGTARFTVLGETTAMVVDGQMEMPVGAGNRSADVYLDAGAHDVTIYAYAGPTVNTLEARWTGGDIYGAEIAPAPFREIDFDLARPEAKVNVTPRVPGDVIADKDGTSWEFKFAPIGIRHVRTVIHEYRGEAVAVNHVEVRDSEANVLHVPTDADLLSLATNDILEIGGGDVVTATYIDEINQSGSSRLLTAKLTATYYNASIVPIGYDFVKSVDGQVNTLRKQLLRIDPGERIVIEVTDFDQDATAAPDKIKVQVSVNEGPPIDLEATETAGNTGIFTKEVDTSATPAEGKIVVKPGDRVFLRYVDQQNTVPGHPAVREAVVYVIEPTPGRVRVIETRAFKPKTVAGDAPTQIRYMPAAGDSADPKTVAGVSFEAPLTIEVIDPDAAKDSRSKVIVTLKTTAGAEVDVECVITDRRLGVTALQRPGSALLEGRFTGQVVMQLGGKDSLAVVPLTAAMPRDLIGGPKQPKEEAEEARGRDRALVIHVLNLTGADIVEATYKDERRPGGPAGLTATARLLTDGKLSCTDADYQKDVTAVHVGERLYLKVVDADLDRTDERDKAKVRIRTKRGEDETVELEETLSHSGIFTGSVMLKPVETPTPGNLKPDAPEIECYFGDTIEAVYVDENSSSVDGKLESSVTIAVIIGTDGKVQAFSKLFSDETLAVQTQFYIAESQFELFKSHKAIGREAEAKADLEAGRRVLREVMEDYPNPKHIPQVSYLLGQFAKELKQYPEAIASFQTIVKQFPDHPKAEEAQFAMAQCYEEASEFNQALEAYVTLAATYPKSHLIENVMVRISEHFYKLENYKVAAQVGEKFLEKFENHKWGPKMAFRVGQCYYKDKQYIKAAETFDKFAIQFREDALCPDSLFWAGESYRTGGNNRKAFQSYNKCRWDFPASEVAQYARGRLALPEMLRQFEEAASNLDKK